MTLLCVYILPTGYSKIGLVPACPKRACPAMPGSVWADPGQKRATRSVPRSPQRRTVLRVNAQIGGGGGGFSSCDEFTQCLGRGKETITCDFVDFALVDYLSVHAYHHFYM